MTESRSKIIFVMIPILFLFSFVNAEVITTTDYPNLKWYTATYKELQKGKEYNTRDINAKYPQFIGTSTSVLALNELIHTKIFGEINEMKRIQKTGVGEGGGDLSETSSSFYYKLTYKVISNINGRIGIEFNQRSEFLDANGNSNYPVIVNYDLVKNREIKTEDLFCNKDSKQKLAKMLPELVMQYLKKQEATQDVIKEVETSLEGKSSEKIKLITLGYRGINLVFPPYDIFSGASGTYHQFIPYKEIKGVICLP